MTGRERAGCPGLGQRGRAGLVLQHVQVVVQSQHLGVFPGGALVHGHEARPVQHLDFHRRQAHVQAAGSIAGRDRVVVPPHADPGPVIHPCLQQPCRVEHLRGQRHHRGLLGGERRGDGDGPASDHPAVIEDAGRGDPLVQRGQRRHCRDGNQVPAAEPADLSLDTAFLMGPLLAGDAEERVEPVVSRNRAPGGARRWTPGRSPRRSARSGCTWRPRARPPRQCGPTPRRWPGSLAPT